MKGIRRIFFLLFTGLFLVMGSYAQTANPQQYKYTFTVAKDGSGEYKFIQDAIDAMRAFPLAKITLIIKNGVYNEKIEIPAFNTDVTFIGESVDKTIITFNDYSGRGKTTTFTSYTAKISGNRFRAENITFQNAAGPVGQAVALHVDADMAVFRNCRFLGDQDTIFASGEFARQYFVNCYIEGTTDFIFGPATAVFDSCTIYSKRNSYITAASTTAGKKFGFVFFDCKLTADTVAKKVFLGRPWRSFAKTAFIRCEMGSHITGAGWHNWSNPDNEKTVLYAEHRNTGPGANSRERVLWSKQLTDREAKEYTLTNIFSDSSNRGSTETSWYR